MATATPMPELVRISASPGYAGGFMAIDDSGQPVIGTFSVQMLASAIFPVANTEIAAVSAGRQGEPRTSGFLCGLIVGKQLAITIDGTGPITTMSASAVGSQLLMRLVAPTKAGGMLTCRADYGLAVGTGFTTANTLPTGIVGAVSQNAPQDVEAIALYNIVNAPSTCPPPVFR